MNTRAFIYEGLGYEKEDFQAPKNTLWTMISNFTERMGKRYAMAEMVRRERVQLSRMSNRELADIGVTRFEAQREVNRSFSDLAGIYR